MKTISIYDTLVKANPEVLATLGEQEIKRRLSERNRHYADALALLAASNA